tara:strand:+ start:296 stop:1282 length:987 start_codon:yes stop_codon:yes gene_type:complete
MGIPLIPNNNQGIPNITVNGTGIPLIPIQSGGVHPVGIRQTLLADIRNVNVRDTRPWMVNPPQALPVDVPVTVLAGTPVVNMPGCVTVHKENAKKDPSRNKMLVNDDPNQNVTLCDAGMPYYQPPDYDYRELSWQTVYMNDDEEAEGIDSETDTPDAPVPDAPAPPPAGGEYKDPDCPGPLDPRVGAVGPNEKEKVVSHELQPDPNNLNKKICVALYEPIGVVEQYLPSAQVATTTAVIASVAASSALLAKPLADLILKVVKPAVKKVIGKVNAILGKTPYQLTEAEKKTNEYRLKKGLLAIPFAKNHQKREKSRKKIENQKKTPDQS